MTRGARKQPTQNIAGKKRAHQEDVDSDYLFANSSSFLPSTARPSGVRAVGLVSASSANFMQLFDVIYEPVIQVALASAWGGTYPPPLPVSLRVAVGICATKPGSLRAAS